VDRPSAARPPFWPKAFVWGLAGSMLSLSVSRLGTGADLLTQWAVLAGGGVITAATLFLIRYWRGHLDYGDALLALAWLHPGLGRSASRGDFAGLLVATGLATASFLLLVLLLDRPVRPPPACGSLGGWLRAALVAVGSLLWLSMLVLPTVPRVFTQDESGHAALAQLYANPRLAGIDWAYTYGPLGGFLWPIYHSDLYWQQLGWEVLVKLFIVLALLRLFKNQNTWERVIYLSVLIAVVPMAPLDTQYWYVIAGVAVLVVRDGPVRAGTLTAGLLLLAVMCMVKFTLFVFSGVCVIGILLALWVRHSPRVALVGGSVFVFELLAVWFFCGQSLANIVPFLRLNIELASGHSEAMSLIGSPTPLIIALLLLGFAAPAAIASGFLGESKRIGLLTSAFVSSALLLAWKGSFVRQDGEHEMQLFTFAVFLAFVLFERSPARSARNGWFLIARYLWLIIALAGFVAVRVQSELAVSPNRPAPTAAPASGLVEMSRKLRRNLADISAPGRAGRRLEKALAKSRRRYDLPRIRAVVGNEAIDFISPRLGEVFLNGLTWRPRPVFLSTMAYTPKLLEVDADFLAGDRAPPFVALSLGTVDRRYPTLNDGPALGVLIHRYTYFLEENGYLLFRRATSPRSPGSPLLLWQRRVRFGELVHLPSLPDGSCHWVQLAFEKSARGKAMQLLFRLPPIALETIGTDGKQMWFRIVPGMSASGFIINPRLVNGRDLARWLQGGSPPRTRSLRVELVDPGHAGLFSPEIQMTLVRDDACPSIE